MALQNIIGQKRGPAKTISGKNSGPAIAGPQTTALLIQHFEADFLWKVSLKILNSELTLKASTHGSGELD